MFRLCKSLTRSGDKVWRQGLASRCHGVLRWHRETPSTVVFSARRLQTLPARHAPGTASIVRIPVIRLSIEMPFTRREKAFCVLEYARTQSNKTVQRAFVKKSSKQSPTGMQIWTWHKELKEKGCLGRQNDLDDQ
ncbi:uncharacterized protein LOC143035575 [Oratosquilla oratoria]|uniref:uncharacterized protein LOC143035575 n=1 Tax=Oratosquilla oratoria TaxID=337810 RepID=UPI003F764BEE